MTRDEVPPEEAEWRARVKEARRELAEAEKAHRARVQERRRALKGAERDHARAVKRAQRELRDAERTGGDGLARARSALDAAGEVRLLARFDKLELYEDRIETPLGSAPLSTRVHAVVDTAANLVLKRRAALARVAATSDIGERVVDEGRRGDASRLYLLVDAPELASVVACPRRKEEAAADFAARVNLTALNAENYARQRDAAVAGAHDELARLEDERAPAVEAARRALAEAEADTAAVDAARRALAEAEADTAEVEGRRADLARLEASGPETRLA